MRTRDLGHREVFEANAIARVPSKNHHKMTGLPGLLERMMTPRTPLQDLEGRFNRNCRSTSDKVAAMESALRDTLSGSGNDAALLSSIRKIPAGQYSDTMFIAALNLLSDDSGRTGSIAGKIAETLLPKISKERIITQLSGNMPCRRLEEAAHNKHGEDAARLLARMCMRVRHDAEQLVVHVSADFTNIQINGQSAEVREAARITLAGIRLESIDAVA
jgi:hypothetical protein